MSDSNAVGRAIVRALREPLVQFALLAALMIAVRLREDADAKRIVVDDAVVAAIVARHEQQYGLPPTATELQLFVNRYVTEELLYREGRALRLDQEDEVVRRRIVQKMQFLQEDVDALADPNEAQVEAFYRSHLSRYTVPRRVSFTHTFFSSDVDGGLRAKLRAQQALATLVRPAAVSPRIHSDVFDGARDYSAMSGRDAVRVFGQSELSHRLLDAPLRRWSGPYHSAFGWHLVFVRAEHPARLQPIGEVLDRVRADYLDQLAEGRSAAALAELRSRYTVVMASAIVGNAH